MPPFVAYVFLPYLTFFFPFKVSGFIYLCYGQYYNLTAKFTKIILFRDSLSYNSLMTNFMIDSLN